jgi:hypothetical protein
MPKLNTTTSGIITATLTADSSPTLELQENGVTISKLGVQPAFSAYASVNQSLSSGGFTKIQMNTEEFDTTSCYDPTTNYRFLPNVSGYYKIDITIRGNTGANELQPYLYKNGSAFKGGQSIAATSTNALSLSVLVYMNGTTDYLEAYAYAGGSATTTGNQTSTYWSAFLARAA